MSVTFTIAARFLLAKKTAMLMTLGGIVFGVGFFILTQAQTSGFERFFIKTILGTDGAIRVGDRFRGPADTQKVVDGIRHPDGLKAAILAYGEVSAAAEVLRGGATLDTGIVRKDVQVLAVNLDEFLHVSAFRTQIVAGSLETFAAKPGSVILGSELAHRADIRPGDSVNLVRDRRNERHFVAGLFETGIGDIDKVRVVMHLPAGRELLGQSFGCSYIQVAMPDPARAPAISAQFEEKFSHSAAPWQKREQIWLDVFAALRVSSAVTVMTIVLVSALGMYNTLAMLVMEKTKEIAILRSMGYSRRDILAIFLWLGVIVLAAGSLLGCAGGAAATALVEHLPLRIRGIFSTDHFVVDWNWRHYAWAIASASVIVMIAALFPARRAARLEPGDIIRGTSS